MSASADKPYPLWRTLDSKNFKLFTRNRERIWSEIRGFILMFGVLSLFGYLTYSKGRTDQTAGPAPSDPFLNSPISQQSALNLCGTLGYFGYPQTDTTCVVYLGDTSSGNGCTAELATLIADPNMLGGNDQICMVKTLADQQQYYNQNGLLVPLCKCMDPSNFSSLNWAQSHGALAAIQFSPHLSSGAYTIYGRDVGLTESDVNESNIAVNNDASSAAYNIFGTYSSILAWQVAIDSALISRSTGSFTPLTVTPEYFPQNAYVSVKMSGVTYFPLYVILICSYGLISITSEICKETKLGLRHGLFMIGLDPFAYWLGWVRMMCYRLLPQFVCLVAISVGLIVINMNPILLIVALLLYLMWLMMFSVFIGLIGVDPDTCSLVLIAGTSLTSCLVYLFVPYFYKASYIPPIPASLAYFLAYLFPPFAMGMVCMCGMYFTSVGQSLNFSSAVAMTPFNITCANMIVALAVSFVLLVGINYALVIKTRGIAVAKSAKKAADLSDALMRNDVEKTSDVAVSIQGLSKQFTRADGTINKAVDGLTVDFYDNQITSFLGHNGAGKSTAISMLTGLFHADSGDAFIKGHSITTDMISIRPQIGVCPQTNILWDLLTCREHMQLFSRIRQVSDHESEHEIEALLKDIGLNDKADTYAKDLSGGQKRKLSTAIALIGNPRVVFLDEPTAGMDSAARRDMWDLLLKKKKGKAIILCTHQMDEAEILGDRVAVVSGGKLQEAGTPGFLKAKYGRGVRVDITVNKGADRKAIMTAINQHNSGTLISLDMSDISNVKAEQDRAAQEILEDKSAGDMHVFAPMNSNIASIIEALEKCRSAGMVEDFGLTAPNLEDVFWELGKKAELERGEISDFSLPDDITIQTPPALKRVEVILLRFAKTFVRDFWKQIRNSLYAFMYVTFAIVIVSLTYNFAPTSVGTLNLTAAAFNNVKGQLAVAYDGGALPTAGMVSAMTTLAKANSALPLPVNATGVSPCLEAWLLDTTDPFICEGTTSPAASTTSPNQGQAAGIPGYVGAYEFSSPAIQGYQYTVLTNQSVETSLPGLVSFANNAIWSSAPHATNVMTLSMSYGQWVQPISPAAQAIYLLIVALIVGTMGSFLFCISMTILCAKLAMTLVNDKKNGIKQLQILMGVTRIEYVVCHCLWDLIQTLILMLIPVIVIFALDNLFASGTFLLALILFFMAMIPLVHMISYTLHEPDVAYSSTYSLLLTSFAGLFILNTIYGTIGLFVSEASSSAQICNQLVMIHPLMALQQALLGIVYGKTLGYNPISLELPSEITAIYGNYVPAAGLPCLYLFAEAIFFLGLYIYIEYSSGKAFQYIGHLINQYLFRCVCCSCCYAERCKNKKYQTLGEDEDDYIDISTLPLHEVEDADVQTERHECDQDIQAVEMVKDPHRSRSNDVELTSTTMGEAVLASHIHMEYPPANLQRWTGTIAVRDFSLRIKKRECFALLGSNGAGKTTVMAVLLKQLNMTSGRVFINGKELHDVSDDIAKTMSYCPQHNALFDSLTAKECLEFYCRIRGVSEEHLEKHVQQWMAAADLKAHEHTRCGELSGGNKRKLSLSISLVGNPDFIVLDEPSAGVDPAARRKLHWLINATKRRGATIVLTTHHMDEAATLGNRVGIMVKGYLTCLGTVQHLLHKYSSGYLLTAFMSEGYSVDEHLLPTLKQICPNMHIGETSGAQFCSVILGNAKEFSISALYAAMQHLQQEKKVEYFTCGQSRLEDVFLHLTDKFVRKRKGLHAPTRQYAAGGDGPQVVHNVLISNSYNR